MKPSCFWSLFFLASSLLLPARGARAEIVHIGLSTVGLYELPKASLDNEIGLAREKLHIKEEIPESRVAD